MRLAVSGSHRVGKTTLAEALADAYPQHDFLPEPYRLLEEEGHDFTEMPSIEDLEAQLERSFLCIEESGANTIFDRCPLDFLGYLVTHRDAEAFRLADWLPRVQETVRKLDIVVFVPIEVPDRIVVPRPEARLRAEVDAALGDIIVDDAYGLGFDVIITGGPEAVRLRQVIAHLP